MFLGNLPAWVTADDIKGWLTAESLVADAIKVIRNPETQESKGFAFIDAPNHEEMNAIIRRFDRAPLEDRLLRANPAQPPKPRTQTRPGGAPGAPPGSGGARSHASPARHSSQAGHGDAAAHGDPAGYGDPAGRGSGSPAGDNPAGATPPSAHVEQRPPRRGKKSVAKRSGNGGPHSAFAEELAKAL